MVAGDYFRQLIDKANKASDPDQCDGFTQPITLAEKYRGFEIWIDENDLNENI